MQSFLRELYLHMEWADGEVWRAALAVPNGDDDVLQDTLLHHHLVQQAYFDVWRGVPWTEMDRTVLGSPTEILDWARPYYPAVMAYLDGLSASDHERGFEAPWAHFIEEAIGGPPEPVTLGSTIYQVVSHSMYHRGQTNRRIRELGGEPPMVDYVVWLWKGRPLPDWPTAD